MKPGNAQFRIGYGSGEAYEPDLVVETKDRIVICEIKDEKELGDPVVQAKASVASEWCRAVSEHAARNGGEPWGYALIPGDQILANASVAAGRQGSDAPPTAGGAAQIDPQLSFDGPGPPT